MCQGTEEQGKWKTAKQSKTHLEGAATCRLSAGTIAIMIMKCYTVQGHQTLVAGQLVRQHKRA
jgi:hypothetical protein